MEVPIEIKTLFSYDHRILKIKNFEITILKIDDKNNTSVEESRSHIKYTIIKEHQGVNIVLERIDSGEKYKIRLPTEDDATNLINSINEEKTNYEISVSFISAFGLFANLAFGKRDYKFGYRIGLYDWQWPFLGILSW